jgi:hypothetical protein
MMDSNGHVRVTLLGGAKSSNGREVFDDEHGQGQVTLRNGGAFAAKGGVLVTGRISRGGTVMFSYAPASSMGRGYAVWKLTRAHKRLVITAARDARSATLVADGRVLPPTMVIAPARPVASAALQATFAADMHHLEAVANGDPTGACAFYKPNSGMVDDARCARTIGLQGKADAIRASVDTVTFQSYNGYTIAYGRIEDQWLGWILDGGHFRVAYGYTVV